MKVIAVIAARNTSTRLPGKVLKPIMDAPMLSLMIRRLDGSSLLDEIVVAIPDTPENDVIEDVALGEGVFVVRGSEEDVLGRYAKVAQERQADVIVRLTGDCPLIDAIETDKVIEAHLKSPQNDITTNIFKRTYPRGFDTEVLSRKCLLHLHENIHEQMYREHVTNYIYDYPEQFKIENVAGDADYSNYRLCVDTPEDFTLITKIFEAFYEENPQFGLGDIMEFLAKHPELVKVNETVEQVQKFKNYKDLAH